jgi:dipeptidase E
MTHKRLLLLSNSTNYGEPYLGYPAAAIKEFLGAEIKRTLFVPFAGVRFSFDEYARTVRERFKELGYALDSVHEASDPQQAVKEAEAIIVGGGNTFHLLRGIYEPKLIEAIRARVEQGAPYIGWSAGANVACPTIRTTNDMPIVEPPSLDALNLVPFQINPHYTDALPTGHAGETRDERLQEFTQVNPNIYVVGLREGTMLRIEDASIQLLGEKSARIFLKGHEARDCTPQDSLEFLLQRREGPAGQDS